MGVIIYIGVTYLGAIAIKMKDAINRAYVTEPEFDFANSGWAERYIKKTLHLNLP